MRARIESGMEAGAWGISSGLDYKPAYFAHTSEVVAVLKDAARSGTVFSNHDRLTPETGFSSLTGMAETLTIGEATGLAPVITHMKVQGWEQGRASEILRTMDEAERRGVHAAADVYPYLAGQTSLAALIIPGWAQEGGREAMLNRFRDRVQRVRIVREAEEAMKARFGGATGVYLPETQRELADLMTEMGATTGGEAVVRLLEQGNPGAILRFGSEADLVAILQHPTASIACDCGASLAERGHPRGWGTYQARRGCRTHRLHDERLPCAPTASKAQLWTGAAPDPGEPVDVGHREVDTTLLRCGKQMQHRVGGSTHGDVERHGVFESLEGGDGTGQCRRVVVVVIAPRQFDDQSTSAQEEFFAVSMGRQH